MILIYKVIVSTQPISKVEVDSSKIIEVGLEFGRAAVEHGPLGLETRRDDVLAFGRPAIIALSNLFTTKFDLLHRYLSSLELSSLYADPK